MIQISGEQIIGGRDIQKLHSDIDLAVCQNRNEYGNEVDGGVGLHIEGSRVALISS